MAFVVANDGDNQMTLIILNKATPENLVMKLFSSNTTPSKADTTATYTICTGSGYADINLVAASWTVTEGTGNGTTPTSAAYPQPD